MALYEDSMLAAQREIIRPQGLNSTRWGKFKVKNNKTEQETPPVPLTDERSVTSSHGPPTEKRNLQYPKETPNHVLLKRVPLPLDLR